MVCADLRGYGDSAKPATDEEHRPYSKRAMAQDQVEAMEALGFTRFAVVGHDRGGRCAYRMALDHPDRVAALAVLDILPTGEHFRRTGADFALGYWHWFFLAQPHPLPETLISADPDAFYLRRGRSMFAPEALSEYRRCFTDPATIHAMCEDYRAAVSIDWPLDEADKASGSDRLSGPGALGRGGLAAALVRRRPGLARLGPGRERPRDPVRPLPRGGSAGRDTVRAPRRSFGKSDVEAVPPLVV